MKKAFALAGLLFASLGIDVPVRQVKLETKLVEIGPGIVSADFGLDSGHVYANFPSDMAPGDRVSGSLAVVPNGKTEAERSANASALGALTVEIGGAKFPVSGGLFVSPRVSGKGMEILLDIHPIARLFVEPKVTTLPDQPAFILPSAAVAGGRSRVLGPFGGDVSATEIRIGGRAVHAVAESPRACIFDVPEGPAGTGRIEVRDGANESSGPFRIIGLHLTPPTPIIHTGDTTSFAAEVYGLDGIDRDLSLILRNLSTGVVVMEGGEEQTLTIAPKNVSAAGTFAISRRLTGIHRGDYAVNVSVPWGESKPVKERAPVSIFDAVGRLPEDYKIVHGKDSGFHAELDSLRPGLPLAWDEAHGTWTPPGYVADPLDSDRAFNQTSGGNAVWDAKTERWIDANTGKPLSYAQGGEGREVAKASQASSPIARGGREGISFTEAMRKLPAGYKIVHGKDSGFHAELDSLRPGLPLAWDEAHGTWTPPGFVPDPSDRDRAFNPTTGGNAVWDDKASRWIDAKTGQSISYEQ